MQIQTVIDSERGCGWRKPGGLYLRSDGLMAPCGRLPIPLGICPCCSAGIKQARSWTWINPKALAAPETCDNVAGQPSCSMCPLGLNIPEKAGLLWIGGKFYGKPEDFTAESLKLGVSRRINSVPKGFVVGQTWVFIAHKDACGEKQPGMFHAFKPSRIEYVVKGDESEDKLAEMVKRGITPVMVARDIDLQNPELTRTGRSAFQLGILNEENPD